MEIYNFYRSWTMTLVEWRADDVEMRINGLIFGIGFWLILFILQGIGLYTMAKKRSMNNKWLAFVPFANIYYIGKLTGECDVFGQKMKRAGLYTMIANTLVTLVYFSVIAVELYLYITQGLPDKYNELNYTPQWYNLTGFAATAYEYYALSGHFISILQLAAEVLMLILLMGLLRKYTPKHYVWLGLLSALVPVSRYIVIFILRNRKEIDYVEYVRAQREAFFRQQQQYRDMYGNPNGRNNPYGNPYQNPYGNPYGNQNQQTGEQQPVEEDPFSEFPTRRTGNDGENGQNSSNHGDGFFD